MSHNQQTFNLFQTKECTKCKEDKPLSEFYIREGRKSHGSICKQCAKEKSKNRYSSNRVDILNKAKEYYISNKDNILVKAKEYRDNNKDKINKYAKVHRDKNRDKKVIYSRNYYKENKEKLLQDAKVKNKNLSNKQKEKRNKRSMVRHHRLKRTSKYRKSNIVRWQVTNTITRSNRNKTFSTSKIFPNPKKLFDHIESQFDLFMTWENHGLWHVDHIKPISYYNSKYPNLSDELFCKLCNRLDNLQPLWAFENLSKGDRYTP